MWFHYYCQKHVSAIRWSKITPGRRWSRSQQEADLICRGQIFSQRMALNDSRLSSENGSTWTRLVWSHINVFRLSRCQTEVQTDSAPLRACRYFLHHFFFPIKQELSGKHSSVLLTLGIPNPVKWSSVSVAVLSPAFCVLLKYINSTWSKWNSCCKIEIYHFCLALNVKVAL